MATIHHCMVCGNDTSTRCNGCIQGLDVSLDPAPTFYCSKDCQVTDWKNHKTNCKLANDRKVLKRAGDLLLDTFCDIRKAAFDINVVKVEVQGDKLHVWEVEYETNEMLVDFPKDLFATENDARTMLTWWACSDAMSTMIVMVTSAVKGQSRPPRRSRSLKLTGTDIFSSIFEVNLDVERHMSRVVMHNSPKSQLSVVHQLFRITLRDGETYALDLTGSQYGQHKPVVPWKHCMKILDAKVNKSLPFGTEAGRREAGHKKLLYNPAGLDRQNLIYIAHDWLASLFKHALMTQSVLDKDVGLAALLSGTDACIAKASNVAKFAVADLKPLAEFIRSWREITCMPDKMVEMYLHVRAHLPEGEDLQTALHAELAKLIARLS